MPMPSAPTIGRDESKVFMAAMKPFFAALVVRLAAEQVLLGHAAILEHQLRRLRRADAHLVLDLAAR